MGNDIESYSTEELEAELERRKLVDAIPRPLPRDKQDFTALAHMCHNYVSSVCGPDQRRPKNIEVEIFETAIETFYGPEVWGPINKALK
jgi:hypothetical protein